MNSKKVSFIQIFLNTLPSSISKDEVEGTIDSINKNIRTLKTSHNTYSKFVTRYGLKSALGKEIESRVVAVTSSDSIDNLISMCIRRIDGRLEELSKIANKVIEEDNPKVLMTYDKANVLKVLDLFAFWVDYSESLMRFICSNEYADFKGEDPEYSRNFEKKINANLGNWISVSDLILEVADLNKLISKSSDAIVVANDNPNNDLDKTRDPVRAGFIGTYFNIPYLVTDLLGELAIKRHEYLTDQKNSILLHIQYLESQYEEGDAGTKNNIEKAIEKCNTKIKKIEYGINKIEEDSGL